MTVPIERERYYAFLVWWVAEHPCEAKPTFSDFRRMERELR